MVQTFMLFGFLTLAYMLLEQMRAAATLPSLDSAGTTQPAPLNQRKWIHNIDGRDVAIDYGRWRVDN